MNESLTRSQVFFQIDFFFHAAYIMHNVYMHKPRMTTRRTSFNREFLRNTPHKDFIAPYILCPRSVRFSNAFRRTRSGRTHEQSKHEKKTHILLLHTSKTSNFQRSMRMSFSEQEVHHDRLRIIFV